MEDILTFTAIINLPEFKRLSNISQLGCIRLIHPNIKRVNYSRYEHSVKTYLNAKKFMNILQSKYPDKVTDDDVKQVSFASLLHDIGHGPYSHVFDILSNENHEIRTKKIIHYIKDSGRLPSGIDVDILCRLVEPNEDDTSWKFKILANKTIDVDRLTYIRDDSLIFGLEDRLTDEGINRIMENAVIIDDYLIYDDHDIEYITSLRGKLYKEVYRHPSVLEMEGKIIEQFPKPKIGTVQEFIEYVEDDELFCL